MTKYILSRPNGPEFAYPTFGFVATDGAILDGSLSDPAITDPPDQFWSVYGGGSAETGITRNGTASGVPAVQPADGSVAVYSRSAGGYVPTDPAELFSTLDTGWRDLGDMAPGASLPPPYEMLVYVRRQGGKVRWRVMGAQVPVDFGGIVPSLGVGWKVDGPGDGVGVPVVCNDGGGGSAVVSGRARLVPGQSWDGALYFSGVDEYVSGVVFEFEHDTSGAFPDSADYPGTAFVNP